MARTQQDWFGIFDHQRRIAVERLGLLQRFECIVQNSSTYICNRRIPKVAEKKCRCLQQCRKTNAS